MSARGWAGHGGIVAWGLNNAGRGGSIRCDRGSDRSASLPLGLPDGASCSRRWIACSAVAAIRGCASTRRAATNDYGCRLVAVPEYAEFGLEHRDVDFGAGLRPCRPGAGIVDAPAIAHGIDAAFDARIEAMRDELKACLGLSPAAGRGHFFAVRHRLATSRAVPGTRAAGPGADHGDRGGAIKPAAEPRIPRADIISAPRPRQGSGVQKREPIAGLALPSPASRSDSRRERRSPRGSRNRFDGACAPSRRSDGERHPCPASNHGLLEAGLAGAERSMPRRNRGALA